VADYIAMLSAELRGERYSKAQHRRALVPHLAGRTKGSIERKHQNVSAVLIDLGYPYVDGYKPLSNYQGDLYELVLDVARSEGALATLARSAVEAPASVPPIHDILDRWESPPVAASGRTYATHERTARLSVGVNYLEIEGRNRSLGLAGEALVVEYERARLLARDRAALADRVEHVSITLGDGAGFDVRSFELNGADRLIEVKTTAYGKETPFFLSRNELHVSRQHSRAYHLYRLFRFRDDPRLFGLRGALDESCVMEPVHYSARVR
jgi:hypothetical protein